MAETPKAHELLELLNRELVGLELKDPGSREKLRSSSEEILDIMLNSRHVIEFLTRLAKTNETASVIDYDHVVDFFNAKSRRNLKRKAEFAAEARAKAKALMHPEKK
jgi:hypothetical protein